MNILEIIRPIKLLQGSHPDIAITGSGCAMNVISYLNGESEITDSSPCVCVTARPPIIFLNDHLAAKNGGVISDDDALKFIPLMFRAMGSNTNDLDLLVKRSNRAVALAEGMARIATTLAEAEWVARTEARTAMWVALVAAGAARAAAIDIKDHIFRYLDDILPTHCEFDELAVDRAIKLRSLATA